MGCGEIDHLLNAESYEKIKAVTYNICAVDDHAGAMRAIESGQFDACLVNFDLNEKTGLDLVRETNAANCGLPFILLTDGGDQQVDAETMAAGVVDNLIKDQVTEPLLARAIRYGIERKRIELRLAALAEFDELTGLANRSHFLGALRHEIAVAKRTGVQLGIFFLDLDRFKRVNDEMGHMMGDHLLMKVADVLRECCRETDTIVRLGGDEFAILATNIEDSSADAVASKILSALSRPFTIVGHQVDTSISIGITLYPSDEENIERLLANADLAMYGAKAVGGNTFRYFDANLSAELKRKRQMSRFLREALECGDLLAHYQPVIDLSGTRFIGPKCWRLGGKEFVAPSEFIPIAESDGMIDRQGERMLLTACRDCVDWQAEGLSGVGVAVNVSPSQFKHSDMVEVVLQALRESRLDPGLLELELTENTIMRDFEGAADALQKLRSEGVRIAIDDFGTGYSSLAYLKHLPVDRLKIDKFFIAGVESEFGDRTISRAVIRLCSGLGIDVTAEGVENENQLRFLSSKKRFSVQGYYFAKPMPLERFVTTSRNWNDG